MSKHRAYCSKRIRLIGIMREKISKRKNKAGSEPASFVARRYSM